MTIHAQTADLTALLEWQIDLGATDAIGDVPVNRYDLPETKAKKPPAKALETPAKTPSSPVNAVNHATTAAASCTTLDELKTAMSAFDHCDLKKGARNLVFADGNPTARLMIIGEAPGREEDREGRPFVGRAGQLLDRMFTAIDLARTGDSPDNAVYITNVLPWRPPQNRDPLPEEIEMMLPFLKRHIELANPEVLVLTGNIACLALLGQKGITRLRGNWATCEDLPTMPMVHPAYLLRNPIAKREAWADLLAIKSRLSQAKTP